MESAHLSLVDLEASTKRDCQGCSSAWMERGGYEFQEEMWLFFLVSSRYLDVAVLPTQNSLCDTYSTSWQGVCFSLMAEVLREAGFLKLKTGQKMTLSLIYQRNLKKILALL